MKSVVASLHYEDLSYITDTEKHLFSLSLSVTIICLHACNMQSSMQFLYMGLLCYFLFI